MGRVQTPTLGFVVEREKAIQAFVPTPYWAVQAFASGIDFRVRFHEKDDPLAWRDEKGKFNAHRTNDSTLANKAHEYLKLEGNLIASKVSLNNYKRSPRAPFTTDTISGYSKYS